MKKTIYIVNTPRQIADRQVYIQSFCEAWINSGGKWVNKGKWIKNRFLTFFFKLLAYCHFSLGKKERVYVVPSRGGHLLKSAVPYCFHGEIVPMLWDCWPSTHDTLVRHLKLLNCRTCFVTSSDVAKLLTGKMPKVKFVHLPEGVDVDDYQEGCLLRDRNIDVFEMGRQHLYYHRRLLEGNTNNVFSHIYNRSKKSILFDNFKELTYQMACAKIVICFPRSMTNPLNDCNISTLTIRYWEAMLSRSILLGHCPQELIGLIGYNPVIEADFVDPCAQIKSILMHIDDYQKLVDHNREVALRYAPWSIRINDLRKNLKEMHY